MEKPVKIYLGDLTYDTIALSTEVFPLNIGFVGSYCIDRFGSDVEITLFKYIEKLERAIHEAPPTILGLSNYAWNQRLDLEIFRILLKQNPHALTVWGGPNFPADMASQENFMAQYHEVDAYVPIEGEIGFSNIVQIVLDCDSMEEIKKKVSEKPIDGVITRRADGKLQYGNPVIRIKHLDEVPSPYISGLLDEFFDGRLTPMIQTNRGCPFSCTFCTDGSDNVRKVNQFSIERVKADINYIGKHVSKNIHSLEISDLNFGMYRKDLEVCDAITEVQNKYGYPTLIQSTTGKNKHERIIESIQRLDGIRLMMSVQSMDEQVLINIRRDNISVSQMMALAPAIKEKNLRTTCEVILGLPGETYKSHVKTLQDLVKANMDFVRPYTLMLIHGAELSTPEQRKKWGFKTKFRVLPKDFVKLSNGKIVLEIEEVVVSNNTLTFDEYVELRLLTFIMFVTNIGIRYDAILKLLREYGVDVFELFHRSLKQSNQAPSNVREILKGFQNTTVNELWDSPEEIEQYYQEDSNYQKLLDGEDGINVIQHYHGLVTAKCMDEWTDYTAGIAHELLQKKVDIDENLESQILDVVNYCRSLGHNTMGRDRMNTNPEFTFNYNIMKWLNGTNGISLSSFKLSSPIRVAFELTDDQFKVVEDELDLRGNSDVGRSHALKHIHIKTLLRRPVILKESYCENLN
jgi:radical SAM superfamily enzyme YgiQ (UPF0313 family)